MAAKVRNLDYIRGRDPKLFEALQDLIGQHQNLAQQVNGNSSGDPLPPPPIDSLTVSGQNGHFDIQISHAAEIYRGVRYYAEYADNSGFSNPRVVPMGDSRNHSMFLGNGTYYWRAYAAYPTSPAGAPAYHGGRANPRPVSGGGGIGGPAFLATQGSGTGLPGEGISGPGQVPFRSKTGIPPIRGASSGSGGTGSDLVAGPSTGVPEGASISGVTQGGGGAGVVQLVTVTQAQLAALAATLNTGSAGLRAYVSDYDHTLVWSGTAWIFASGERAGFIEGFLVDPSPATGWQLCDGTQVTFLKSDGTTGTTGAGGVPSIPNLTGSPSYLKFGTAVTGVVAPVAPALTMNSYTPAGTIAATLTMNSYTPAGTISALTFTGSAMATHSHEMPFEATSATTTLRFASYGTGSGKTSIGTYTGVGSSVLGAAELTQAVSAGTPAGTINTPTFTGTPAVLTGTVAATFTGTPAVLTGTISTTGEPQSVVLRPWFRR